MIAIAGYIFLCIKILASLISFLFADIPALSLRGAKIILPGNHWSFALALLFLRPAVADIPIFMF